MEALKFVTQQDERQRRPTFSRSTFLETFPSTAGGLFSDRMCLRLRVEDDGLEVFDPRFEEDSGTIVVSAATPSTSQRVHNTLVHLGHVAALRTAAQVFVHPEAANRELEQDVVACAEAALAATATNATVAQFNRDDGLRRRHNSSDCRHVQHSPAHFSKDDLVQFLPPFHRDDASMLDRLQAVYTRAAPFAALVVAHDVLAPVLLLDPHHSMGEIRTVASTTVKVSGGLEAMRWRLARAAVDGGLCEALRASCQALSRRLQRRQLTVDTAERGHDVAGFLGDIVARNEDRAGRLVSMGGVEAALAARWGEGRDGWVRQLFHIEALVLLAEVAAAGG